MSDENSTGSKTSSRKEDESTIPSDYVRLEADLISEITRKESPDHFFSQNKSILIYCTSHRLLQEIASELKSAFESDVEILTTTDVAVALKLLNSGEVDLLLHGASPELTFPNLAGKKNKSMAGIGSALILMNTPNPSVKNWMNDPEHSRHLTHAISRLNETGF
jgi:hypothetical protein